jgi:hypothetical protein
VRAPRQSHKLAGTVPDAKPLRRGGLSCVAAAPAVAVVVAAALLIAGSSAVPVTRIEPSGRAETNQGSSSATRLVGALPPLPHGPTGPAHAMSATVSGVAVPTRLTIPAIGVTTSLEPLHLLLDHSLRPPSQWDEAGWYADGVRPGDPGPAVILGHVDSVSGPAVFYRLRELQPGAIALVQLRTGRVLTFVVDTVRTYRKNEFPSAAVYGPTALPELRLITCTGDFDWTAHSYLDNLVVSAYLAP